MFASPSLSFEVCSDIVFGREASVLVGGVDSPPLPILFWSWSDVVP